MDAVKVVGIGGSMKAGSASVQTLQLALEGAKAAGAQTELCEIRTLDLPMYTPDMAPTPAVERFVATVAEAHAMIWSSPVYHGSVSGAFKNALDWLELLNNRQPAYLTHKVVGLISTAGGVQGLQAINCMEFIVRSLRGWMLPLTIPLDRAWQAFDAEGNLRDEQLHARLMLLGREVAIAAQKLNRPV